MTTEQFWCQAFLAALTGICTDESLGHQDVVGIAATIADGALKEATKRSYLDDDEKGKLA